MLKKKTSNFLINIFLIFFFYIGKKIEIFGIIDGEVLKKGIGPIEKPKDCPYSTTSSESEDKEESESETETESETDLAEKKIK